MKPNDIFTRAVRLCGIGEEFLSENNMDEIRTRALDAINTSLFDLCGMEPIDSINSQTVIPDNICAAAVYGTAMFLSLAYGDTDKSALFSGVYNQKRSAVKSQISKISDVLPRTGAI